MTQHQSVFIRCRKCNKTLEKYIETGVGDALTHLQENEKYECPVAAREEQQQDVGEELGGRFTMCMLLNQFTQTKLELQRLDREISELSARSRCADDLLQYWKATGGKFPDL